MRHDPLKKEHLFRENTCGIMPSMAPEGEARPAKPAPKTGTPTGAPYEEGSA